MSGLIKAGSTVSVRPFGTARPGPLGIVGAAEPSPEALALAGLRDELDARETALAALRKEAEEKAAWAREEGRKQGLAEAETDETKRLERLAASLAKAETDWASRLETLDGLALQLARTALAKMFGEGEDLGAATIAALAAKLDGLRREAVVAIRVSAKDFGGAEALAALAGRLGRAAGQVVADPGLGAGECRIDLKLGHLDIGPRAQWAQLDLLLGRMADESGAAA